MSRIAMIVWNDFLHDARVLKEAETLQADGHSVRVHALHTPGMTPKFETLSSGVEVRRVLRSLTWSLMAKRRESARVMTTQPGASAGSDASTPPHAVNSQAPAQTSSAPGTSGARLYARLLLRTVTHVGLLIAMVRYRPEVLHAHDVNTLPTAWVAARLTGARLVYDAHEISTDREGYHRVRGLVGAIEKRLMPRAVATITTTEARAKFFARAYRIPRPTVLQNRPRLDLPPRNDRLRRELGFVEPWPIVLYQGGLQQGRGLARLVEAAASIEGAYFAFVGSGRLAGPLAAQVDSLGIGERVKFVAAVPLSELPSYSASADIGVQPIENTCLNHFTTDSNKLFEYVMAGLPVVASDLPEIRRIVRDHDLGLLVRAGDTDELAGAIRRLVAEPELRETYARNAARAARILNWEDQEESLRELYRRVEAGVGVRRTPLQAASR